MQDDRLRIPVLDSYLHALGLATYTFARLEWDAVWCCERLSSGYLQTIVRKTAGVIATDLIRLVHACADAAVTAACLPAATEFQRLVLLRNGLLHGKPATGEGGEQMLFRDGTPWSLSMIDDASDQFAACSFRLNSILYNELSAPSAFSVT
jgi:hypothetical protein